MKTKTKLDKKTIAAIADKVEARVRKGGASEKRSDKRVAQKSDGSKSSFLWGAASGLALAFAAPLLGTQARPVVKGAIKGGLLAGRYVQKVASSVKEDVQDLSAEASADLDAEGDGQNNPADPADPKSKAK